MKKILALVLAICMVLGLAACAKTPAETSAPSTTAGSTEPQGTTGSDLDVVKFEGDYVYKDSVVTLSANWNPHTYQTADESYPIDYITAGLYTFVFNDALNPVEGKDAFTGYKILPEMAASEPVDVTKTVKAEHPEFNIPESAEAGYAYTIDLNPLATWDDGTPINADTYVESMKRLLDSKLMNYRATDYYAGDFCIAGAEEFANSGLKKWIDNGTSGNYAVADCTKNEAGVYVNPEGFEMKIAVNYPLSWCSGNTLNDYVKAYGAAYFVTDTWETLMGMADENGMVPLTDETLALFTPVVTGNPAWGETEADLFNYFTFYKTFPTVGYETVGLYKTGDYQITLVLGKSLAGFNLLYNLSGNWIVKPDLYDANLKETDGVWTSTYNTSLETTCSYGPYKITEYQTDKAMRFERNEKWYGYTDGKHIYQDPQDGKIYPMYQTTAIECQVVSEASTRKMMFLKGKLMGYGLQSDDFATYRSSEYCYATPGQTIFFLILNGHIQAINEREAAADFDQATTDLQTMTLNSFRRAMAVTYDKDLFASTISPARSGAFGVIGTAYVYDPETGARYRDTDQAKQILCDVYSVDTSKFASLDDAVNSITGYDPVTAKELYKQAFDEAIEKGYITDTDKDGKSDQTVTITYSISADSDFMTRTINYLNEKVNEVTKDTPFDGKIVFVKSAPLGDPGWSDNIKAGQTDTVLGGWQGSVLNPFSLSDLYVNPDYAYDAAWFDATKIDLTLTVPVDGTDTEITMTLKDWSDALNGATVKAADGKEYCFGDGIADVNVRLTILAAIEGEVLKTYNYLPMLQDASMALLSQQIYYVVEDYNPVMGRGGITYPKYNYNETEWADYCASQPDGELQY